MDGCVIVHGAALARVVNGGESNPPESDGGGVQRQELFISYSQKDRAFLEQFWTHLRPLEEDYGLQRWDDSCIRPGDIWLKEIEQALGRAQVALLLVSPDFLASDFIRRKELPALFEAAEKDGLTILWLPIRPCSWKRHRQIEQYQSVGSLDPTLAEMDEVKRDREMVKITDRIHELFERIQNEREAAQQAAEAEALAQSQEAALRLAEQGAQRQKEETARLDRLKADSEARAEAERWRAEAEQLAREKEEWHRQATSAIPQPRIEPKISASQGRSLIQIHTTRGWLVREGNEWRKREEPISVKGYLEELAEGIALTMIEIPAGEFLMGSPEAEERPERNEGPQHRVTLPSFYLGQTPVTQAQWDVVAGWPEQQTALLSQSSRCKGANRPVEQVKWAEAVEFCQRLSHRTGLTYSLPSESQWEYACRAGTITTFSFGDIISKELANYDAGYASKHRGLYDRTETSKVTSFPANNWGLHDMHGNIYEWCLDTWHKSYVGAPSDGSAWITGEGGLKVMRGGSHVNDNRICRSASRGWNLPGGGDYRVGFRICCVLQG